MSNTRETQTNKRHKRSTAEPSTSRGVSTAEPEKVEVECESESIICSVEDRVSLGLSSSEPVLSCQFEVFGIVQGVSFRMYTLRRAQKLGVRGWCQNSTTNTVKGEIEGHSNPFEEMRLWLKYTGSPTSKIDKVIFSDTIIRDQYTYENFSITMD